MILAVVWLQVSTSWQGGEVEMLLLSAPSKLFELAEREKKVDNCQINATVDHFIKTSDVNEGCGKQ